jgi:hypothetical protein
MHVHTQSRLRRTAIGALAIALLGLAGVPAAHAVELVPSIGLSQATDGGDNRMMVAVAFRKGLLPRLQTEFQVAHRSEEFSFAGETLTMRTIPVTASVWASPVPMLYAGGGIGAYFQAIEYDNNLYPASNEAQFGAHLGGGLRFPMTPLVGLDLQGRYVFLDPQSTELASGDFDPSFWTVSAGLAIGF